MSLFSRFRLKKALKENFYNSLIASKLNKKPKKILDKSAVICLNRQKVIPLEMTLMSGAKGGKLSQSLKVNQNPVIYIYSNYLGKQDHLT
jgi:hypothetical protein